MITFLSSGGKAQKDASPETPNEEQMEIKTLEAVRAGEDEAFSLIVQRYQQRLYNYLYRFTRQREDCEDLVSDTLFQAFTQLKTCRDLKSFRAWLFRIAHNIGVNFWRKRARDRRWTSRLEDFALEVVSWVATPATQEQSAVRREQGVILEKALKGLPPHYRSALFLYYYEDFSYKEIAEVLNLPLSSVKTHLFRGRKVLEERLAQALPEASPVQAYKDQLTSKMKSYAFTL